MSAFPSNGSDLVRSSLLESVIRESPSAIALLRGADFTIEMVNPAYQELSPGEPMSGRTVAEVWPEAASLVIPLLRKVRERGVAYKATGQALPLHRGPGSPVEERYFDFSYVPLPHGDDMRVLVVASEVTEYKRVEAQLRAAYAELAAIHAHAPVVLFVIDEEFPPGKGRRSGGKVRWPARREDRRSTAGRCLRVSGRAVPFRLPRKRACVPLLSHSRSGHGFDDQRRAS